jgi:hypothetical protein
VQHERLVGDLGVVVRAALVPVAFGEHLDSDSGWTGSGLGSVGLSAARWHVVAAEGMAIAGARRHTTGVTYLETPADVLVHGQDSVCVDRLSQN